MGTVAAQDLAAAAASPRSFSINLVAKPPLYSLEAGTLSMTPCSQDCLSMTEVQQSVAVADKQQSSFVVPNLPLQPQVHVDLSG